MNDNQPAPVVPPPPVPPTPPALPPFPEAGRQLLEKGRRTLFGTTFRLFLIGILVLLLLIPVFMIKGLLGERQQRRNEAVDNITSSWGKAQEVVGPVLMVPYRFPAKAIRQQPVNGRIEAVEVEEMQTAEAFFFPEHLEINGTLKPQTLHRGIYEAVVYRGDLTVSGTFKRPALDEWKVRPEQILWDEAVVTLAVTDLRGVDGALAIAWDGKPLRLIPGCRLPGFSSGLSAALKGSLKDGGAADTIPFSIAIGLNGSREIRFVPVGVQTDAALSAPWPDPSFTGKFLPQERALTKEQFSAKWQISYYGRSYPQQWTSRSGNAPTGECLSESAFGVSLLSVVDNYRTVERALKYAILFIVLAFSAFFLFEVMSKLRIHPVQYILVGAALCLFYLGLLALSEVTGFGWAYLIGAVLATALIGFYSTGILRSGRRGGMLTGGLALVYGFLYVILQLQDYSLIMGTAGLFIILAAIMVATRKTDWYARDGQA